VLSNFLIKTVVLFLPTQLGLHFWPAFSRVAGIKIDYLSPTLYFIDILLLIIILLNSQKTLVYLKKNISTVTAALLFIVINITFSVSPLNSIFWWLRALLYLFTFLVFRLRHLTWQQIRSPLLFGTTVVVLIEIIQLCLQSSIGGPLYLLGERAFSSSTPGIGRFNLLGLEILRPNSTFSHPNSLAGYLLIVFYLFFNKPSKPWHKLIPFIGILLTFSKSAIVYLAFIIFSIKPEIVIMLSVTFTFIQPLIQNFGTTWQSLSDRLFYYPYLKTIITHNPVTGVGLGNFIPSLGSLLPGSFITPSKLQPIHNLLYLIFTEIGLLGTLLLLLFLIKQKILNFLRHPLAIGLLALIIFTGTFDHYSWTLPQNKLIFLLALSIML
jgi:hypothetical protein